MSRRPAPDRPFLTPYLAMGFLLLTVSLAASILFGYREGQNNNAAQVALLANDDLATMMAVINKADDSVNGYFITGLPLALQNYNQTMAKLPIGEGRLSVLDLQNIQPAERADLRRLVNAKSDQLQQEMRLIQSGDHAAAAAQIAANINLNTSTALSARVVALRDEERERMSVAQADALRDSWELLGTIMATMIAATRLTWLALRAERRHVQELSMAELALRETNQALEAKVAERTATLHASEQRFRQLAEMLPGIVYMADAQGKGSFLNREAESYSGELAPRIHEVTWMGFVHPDDLPGAVACWQTALGRSQDFDMEFRLRGGDGQYRWFLARTVVLKDETGAAVSWIGVATDIHDRKTAEMVLTQANADLERRVEERSADLDRIFRLSADIFTVSDLGFTFLMVSPAWKRILGREPEEALALPHLGLVHPDDLATTLSARLQLMVGQPSAFENRLRHADGSWRWLSWRLVPVPGEQRIYGVARDITAEHEREERLRQSQKMEVVGQLTGGVAHDFNNLLTIILGSLELLRARLTGQEALLKRVDFAVGAAQRAAALTHRLLAFARQQPLEPRTLDVNALLMGMMDLLRRTLGEQIVVDLQPQAGLWQALADTNQLENAILNLAVNARDAMPQGGALHIALANVAVAVPKGDLRLGEYVAISVDDTGTGMVPEVQTRVFEPFFTTKPPGQGTGLGLAQVYGFIKQSGGHVTLQSAAGMGTNICLYLPRAPRTALDQPMPSAALLPVRSGRGGVALVVEDEEGVAQLSAEVLAGLGFAVRRASSAEEARRLVETTPSVALLFTDIVLGAGKTGIDLAVYCRTRHPRAVILFTSGYGHAILAASVAPGEVPNFLGKPFTVAALTEKISQLFPPASA